MDGLKSLRPPGLLERYHITLCELGLDSCVVTSAQYSSASGIPLDSTRIRLALSQIILHHPTLGLQVHGESVGKPVWVRLSTIRLSDVIEEPGESSSLQDVLVHYLSRPFTIGCTRPLWRVSILDGGVVVFSYHHAIGDGQSCIAIHKAFLAALNDLTENLPEPPDVVHLPPIASLLAPVDKLMDVSVPLLTLCREVYGQVAPASWKKGFNSWTGNPVVKVPTAVTAIRLWELSSVDAAKLIKLCRAHSCTLTAFLYVLSIEVISYIAKTRVSGVPNTFKTLSANIAVSLRRFTGTSPDEICDQPSKYHLYTPIASVLTGHNAPYPEFPWDHATEFGRTLHKELGTVRQQIGLLKYLFGRFRKYFLDMLGKKREGTFTLSNIGRFSPSQSGNSTGQEWNIGSMFFGQCDATCGAALKMNVVGGPDGSVGTTVTWGEGAIDDELAEMFVRMVKEWTADIVVHSEA